MTWVAHGSSQRCLTPPPPPRLSLWLLGMVALISRGECAGDQGGELQVLLWFRLGSHLFCWIQQVTVKAGQQNGEHRLHSAGTMATGKKNLVWTELIRFVQRWLSVSKGEERGKGWGGEPGLSRVREINYIKQEAGVDAYDTHLDLLIGALESEAPTSCRGWERGTLFSSIKQ